VSIGISERIFLANLLTHAKHSAFLLLLPHAKTKPNETEAWPFMLSVQRMDRNYSTAHGASTELCNYRINYYLMPINSGIKKGADSPGKHDPQRFHY